MRSHTIAGRVLRGRRAFTLLELTTVLAVVTLLLLLAWPRLGRARDRAKVHGAAGELGALFSLARGAAIARRSVVAIAFDTSAGLVEVRSGPTVLARRSLAMAYGIAMRANRDSIMYDPRGIGYGVANVTVTILRGEFVDTLTMSRMGRVRW